MRTVVAIMLTLLAVKAPAAAASPAATADARRSLVVLDLRNDGVADEVARLVQDTLTVSFGKHKHLQVLSTEDMRRMVGFEADRRQAGCEDDTACLVELANALGASLVVYGSIGRLGELTVVNVSMFDSDATASAGRETIEVSSLEELPHRVRVAVASLVGAPEVVRDTRASPPPAAVQPEAAEPENTSAGPPLPAWFWVGSAVTVVGAATLGTGAYFLNDELTFLRGTDSAAEKNDARLRGIVAGAVALGGLVLTIGGGAVAATALSE